MNSCGEQTFLDGENAKSTSFFITLTAPFMKTRYFQNYIIKHCTYAVAAAILFLSVIPVSAAGYIQLHHHIRKESASSKDQSQPRMFLIAVIDSEDETIGERCKTDQYMITEAFRDYAEEIEATMIEPKIIAGEDFSKEAVNDAIDNWLKNQQPSGNDIVVFYYSGHGFRYPTDAGNFPRMWLKNGKDRNVQTANLRIKEDVYDRIITMGAGFNMVLSDCCNSTAAGDNANFDNITVPNHKRQTHRQEHTESENDADDMNNADKLFIPGHPLSILITAADKGELAGGKPQTGGFFTNYLIEALDGCIYDNSLNAAWDNIFKYADEKASYWARSAVCPEAKHNEQGRCVQTAAIKIDNGN